MTEQDLRDLFKKNSNCYADTHYYDYDTEPPTLVEDDVVTPALTEDQFVEVVFNLFRQKKLERILNE